MTVLSAASLSSPHVPPKASLAELARLIEEKSPKHAEALKVVARMVLEDLISAEQSPH